MEPHFTFRDIDSSDGLKDHATQKLGKMEKYMIKPITISVIFSHDKFRQCCEINVVDSGTEYSGSETTPDMYVSIDRAVEKVISQLRKNKEIVKTHKGL